MGYHEAEDSLSSATKDRHRAIASLQEELEAVDWYDQRVEATDDAELAGILAHNRDEEKEHASMTLEWIRRRDPKWDEMLSTYLFTDKPVLEVEDEAVGGGESGGGSGDLNIRSLRGEDS